jgi:hypothetical protein
MTVAPTVFVFIDDLMFSGRVVAAIESMGYGVELLDRADRLGVAQDDREGDRPGEHLYGQAGELIDKVSRIQPALMIFDLNNPHIPWRKWLPILTSSPATRRIPIVTFGQHTDVQGLTAAKEAGAVVALARSAFVTDIPGLVKKYARRSDPAAIDSACEAPLSALALDGIVLFDQGEYFEAHEVLEDAWNADDGHAKELYRALLQIAVAYLQIERGNYRGAVKMFLRVRQWLAPLPETCRGVDLAQLRLDFQAVETRMLALGPNKLAELDTALFRPIPLA